MLYFVFSVFYTIFALYYIEPVGGIKKTPEN